MNDLQRFTALEELQDEYRDFGDFLYDGMLFLGFKTTPMQLDIGNFLQHVLQDVMVQAQRGEAKTTITALFAIWCLIHNPHWRILIVSAGGDMASDISTLITKLILNWDKLECLRPDRSAGDRASVTNFDIHGSLKGPDKSASVASIGVTANLQGKRADLLIADDIESQKNSQTQAMRDLLMSRVNDFYSIVTNGRVVFLGTPQSTSSIYNSFPARGVIVRIWPGRYPTEKQREAYGRLLAPSIARALDRDPSLGYGGGLDGKSGKPTDPYLFNEENLRTKEVRQGTSFFLLQHMLLTAMADADKFPLKSLNLVMMRLNDKYPLTFVRGTTHGEMEKFQIGETQFPVMWPEPSSISAEKAPADCRLVYIDPAGGGANGDETGVCCLDYCNSNLYIRALFGVRGGYEDSVLEALANRIAALNPSIIKIEKNFGHGAFLKVFTPFIRKVMPNVAIEDDTNTGQKERRIISTIEPVLGRGSLVIDQQVLIEDWESTAHYTPEQRAYYTFAHQFSNITYVSGCLKHDDRLDALAGAIKHFLPRLAIDETKAAEARAQKEREEWLKNPLGRPAYALHNNASLQRQSGRRLHQIPRRTR